MEASRRGESTAAATLPCRHSPVFSTMRRALASAAGLRSGGEPDAVVALRLVLGNAEAVYQVRCGGWM